MLSRRRGAGKRRCVVPNQAEPDRALLPGLAAPPFQPFCHWRPRKEKE